MDGERSRPERAAPRRTAVLVLGMHRSGTSAMTRVLSLAGAALPANLMDRSRHNQRGYWESVRLLELHEEFLDQQGSAWHDWRKLELTQLSSSERRRIEVSIREVLEAEFGNTPLFVVKDPRICRFVPLFLDVLEAMSIDPRIVVPFRNPAEVCRSLITRGRMTQSDAALLWLRHVLDVEAETRELPRAFVGYDTLLGDWRSAFRVLTRRTDVEWPAEFEQIAEGVDSFLTSDLRHHESTTTVDCGGPLLERWIREAHDALLALEADPSNELVLASLDATRSEFEEAIPLLARVREDTGRSWRKSPIKRGARSSRAPAHHVASKIVS